MEMVEVVGLRLLHELRERLSIEILFFGGFERMRAVTVVT